jgi:hypothetical protein
MVALKQELHAQLSKMREEVIGTGSVSTVLRARCLFYARRNFKGTITIGEAHIVREMRIANDGLRWRLQQKELTITTLRETMTYLRELLAHKDETIAELQKRQMQLLDVRALHVRCRPNI